MAKPEKKKQKVQNTYENDYGGKYDDVMEGGHLIVMRGAIEDLAAGKITKKEYNEIKEGFLNEFPESAINLLKKGIAQDKN